MKKVFSFIRSMRFGIILLLLIAACSVVGTLIPQGEEAAWYAQNYGTGHAAILMLGLNRIFQSWYFIVLMAVLCLNLSLCSLVRIRAVVRGGKSLTDRAFSLPNLQPLEPGEREYLEGRLEKLHCKRTERDGVTVLSKNGFGRYGTFVTHLAILLTVIFGAVALYTPTVTDRSVMPGETLTLEDGTQIQVFDFRLTDETGRLDYASHLQITLPNGRQSAVEQIRVNYPFSFGPYKIFQQSFGTAGSITVTNLDNGGSDTFTLNELSFLSADGRNGLWYEQLYPDHLRAPSGEVTLITITEGSYPNPIYQVQVITDGVNTPTLAVPGDEMEVFGLRFTFNDPVEYPGLRIKKVSSLANGLLIAAFTLMIAGLYVTFFCEPVLVKLDAEGYAVGGPKPERMRLEIEGLLEEKHADGKGDKP